MTDTYTRFAEKSIKNFTFGDQYEEIEAAKDAIEFLNNPKNFRPFDEGLTELITRAGYNGSDEIKPKTDFLISRLNQIGSKLNSDTVSSWFAGKHRPKIEPASRPKMYEICFSLHLSMQNTTWFFHHVYFDRCFNCHMIDEAVFCYCFRNNLNYQDAQAIIREIGQPDENLTVSEESGNYTKYVSEQIESFHKTEDFIQFMKENKSSFNTWNTSAHNTISEYLTELTGKDKVTSADIDKIKRELKRKINATYETAKDKSDALNTIDSTLFKNCGLLLIEIQHDAEKNTQATIVEDISETINNKSVLKNSFVLDRLLNTSSGIQKDTEIPSIVKVNFPSKKSLSDILKKDNIQTLESYDMIRKILVLLHFYIFWLKVKLNDTDITEYSYEDLSIAYKDEADNCLFNCGYEPLYAGNPYDWLFLCSANTEKPIDFFRLCISEILDGE